MFGAVMQMSECWKFKVEGRVQGVWFRDSTRRQAKVLELSGHAINCTDGSVEVIAEGDEDTVKLLISSLNDHFGGYIRSAETSWTEAKSDFTVFDVRS